VAKKILIVDDEPNIVKMVVSRLQANGYDVLSAYGGNEGLEKCKLYKPDAVILDIMMPDIDGTAVAEKLKEDPETSSIPILFLTAAVRSSELPNNQKIGGHYILAKPFIAEELLRMLKRILLAP
jgi:two-component system, sensor histidine kinase and response regulator